jgi:hypothetical protein
MEYKRNIVIKDCKKLISDLEYYNSNDENKISKFRTQESNEYIKNQIIKIKEKLIEREKEIIQLKEKITNVQKGDYDFEINNKIKDTNNKITEKNRLKQEKKNFLSKEKIERSHKSQNFHNITRNSDRYYKNLSKDIDRQYNFFIKTDNSIPEYMLNNLNEMPENKGYYWKNVAYYGKLPAEYGKNTVLFEKYKGNLMYIHEWSKSEYNVYEKKGKDKRKLFSSQKRKKLNNSVYF